MPELAPTHPPDDGDLTCPLCRYSLCGLTDPRCPECDFTFTWAEFLDEQRNKHRYLFEHAQRHRRFWHDVSPTFHPQTPYKSEGSTPTGRWAP